MTLLPTPTAVPFDAVIFDFHGTLIHPGSGRAWLDAAWNHAGREGDPARGPGQREARRISTALEDIWGAAREIDPDSERDLDPVRHREVFDEVMKRMGIDEPLADGLYATLTDGWTAYDDAQPVLAALKADGLRTAVLSNVGFDVRRVLDRTGLTGLVDVVALSYELGVAKPEPAAFEKVLEMLGSDADSTLMVGDHWQDDGGAARVGIRTLLLPPTQGSTHGLDAVTGLVMGVAVP